MKNLDPPILFVDFVRLRLFEELFLPNDCLDEGLDDKAHACWFSNRLDVPHVRMLFALIPLLTPEKLVEKSGSSGSKLPKTELS